MVVLTIEEMPSASHQGCMLLSSSRHAEDRLGHNYSFVSVLQLPDASGTIWINGVQVSCEIQNLSDSPYVDQIDELLHIFQQAQLLSTAARSGSSGSIGVGKDASRAFEVPNAMVLLYPPRQSFWSCYVAYGAHHSCYPFVPTLASVHARTYCSIFNRSRLP